MSGSTSSFHYFSNETGYTYLDSTEIINVVTDQWEIGPSLPFPVFAHCTTPITLQESNTQYLTAGGNNPNFATYHSLKAQIFDWNTNEWTEIADLPFTAYSMGCAPFEAQDGTEFVVITRGNSNNDLPEGKHTAMLDVETLTWNLGPDITTARQHVRALNVQGKVYLFGGTGLASIERLDPTGSFWILSDLTYSNEMQFFSPIAYNI